MAKTIQQILAAPNLIGTIQTVKTGVPNPFDAAFLSTTRNTTGDQGHYNKVDGTRETARLVAYGSESVRRNLRGVSRVPVKLVHTFEHQFHDPLVLQQLLDVNRPDVQDMGVSEIGRQTREFAALFTNLRISAVASMLALGKVHFDGDGNLLPSSSGAVITIDYGVPAGNKDQVGGLVDVKWPTTSANIPKQIEAIKLKALQTTGYELTTAYYGSSVAGWLMANDFVQKMAAGNSSLANSLMSGVIPNGFLGLNWKPAGAHCFVDQNGTVQTIFPADAVVLCPAVTADWYELIQGSYAVPMNLGAVGADAVAAAANVRQVNGMFSYAIISNDPSTIKQMAGDTFLPVLKVPGAIYIVDVDF